MLQDVSAIIPEKTTCAIVGPSGSGKTTLVSLIARFWDVQEGKICVGGHDVKDFTCDSLLKNFSIVFQNVYLFEDTIENNIKFGRLDATREDVIERRKRRAAMSLYRHCRKLPYPCRRGRSLPFRWGAPAHFYCPGHLKGCADYHLDEATASVDPENERELQAAIAELTKDKTIIMIAHRLSTVRNADQILVLDKGRIVQRGTHRELMEEQGLYRRFIQMRETAIGWNLGRKEKLQAND